MLVEEAGLEEDAEAVAVALLEGDRLIDRQAEGAIGHVDVAGEQVGLERRRVLDRLDDDPREDGRLAPPGGVALEHDGAARHDPRDPVGAEGEPRIGRVGIEKGAVAVGGRVRLEDLALEMCRQDPEVVDGVVVEVELLVVNDEGLVVDRIDLPDPPIELGVGDAALLVPADLPGEEHVLRRDRDAVAPGRLGLERIGERHADLAVGCRLTDGALVLQGRQLGAEHADEVPTLVVDRERPLRHAQHIGLGRHRIDVGVEVARELGDADDELVARGRSAGAGQDEEGREEPARSPAHRPGSGARHCISSRRLPNGSVA